LRQFRIEPPLEAGGEEGERLDQPLDVRIGADAVVQLQPRRNLRIEVRELLPHPPEVGKLVEIVAERFLAIGHLSPDRSAPRAPRSPAGTAPAPRGYRRPACRRASPAARADSPRATTPRPPDASAAARRRARRRRSGAPAAADRRRWSDSR